MADWEIKLDEQQIRRVSQMLYAFPDKTRTVLGNAIRRGLTATRVQAEKEIRERYDISAGNLRTYKNIFQHPVFNSNDGVVGEISFAGGKIPLYRYHVVPKNRVNTSRFANGYGGAKVPRQTSAADLKETGLVPRPSAFVARFQSGHVGLFMVTERGKEGAKDKMKELYGFDIADMLDYEDARENILDRAQEVVAERIDHELYRMLNGF